MRKQSPTRAFARNAALDNANFAPLLFGIGLVLMPAAAQAQTGAPPDGATPAQAAPGSGPAAGATPPASQPMTVAAPTLRFWDGSDPARHQNGVIDGGSGVWSATAPSWTDANGTSNGPMQPVPAFAVFQGTPGTVTIDASQGIPSVTGMQFLTDGYRLTGGKLLLDGGAYTSIRPGQGVATRIDAELTGSSGLLFNDFGTLILTGDNSYTGGTRVDAGTLIGNTRSIRGTLENGGTVIFDQQEDGVFTGGITGLSSIWGFMIKRGAGTLTIGGGGLDWRIDEGRLVSPGASLSGNIEIGGAGKLTLTSGAEAGMQSIYRYALSGNGGFDVAGAGTLVLAGQSSGFTGDTRVEGSALRVDGGLGGTLAVGSGGTLSGTGAVGAVTVGSGGRLVGDGGSTLTLSSLALGSGANIDVTFAGAEAPALFAVGGNLTLDGTLNIGGSAPLDEGIYRLLSYGGQLIDNGLAIGAQPSGQASGTLSIQTATPGQVNVVSAIGARPLRFWDGGDATRYANGVVDGGPGTWRNGSTSWTGADGAVNGTAGPSDFVVFAGQGGRVLLDDSDGAISTGGMQFATSGYKLSGDTLTLAGGQRTVVRVGDGSAASSDMTAEIAARITGTSYLVKRDAGTLILSGDNDLAGIEVEAGTLIGNTRAIRGDLSNAGTVVFDQKDNGTFRSGIAALDGVAGKVVKRGAGDLTLTATSTLDWTIEEGRVRTNAARFTGDAALRPGGTIEFASTADTRYLGTLSGTGRLVKAGAGDLAFGTDSRGFTGETLVRAGSLTVDGAIRGRLTVAADAALAGRGSLGSVRIDPGGRIAPGPSIRTLTVTGDLVIAPGARYEVEVDPAGTASDRIDVLGTATLGGTVAHIGASGTYRPSATYTILTAQGGIQGRFDNVTSTYAFLTPSLGYTSNAVTLVLNRNDVRFDQVAATANQRAAGAAVEALASGNGAYDAVITADAAGAREAFDNLSGEFHASLRTALVEGSRLSREATLERLHARREGSGLAIWGQTLDSSRRWGGNASVARLAQDTVGALAGVEAQAPGGFVIGVLGGHHRDALRGRGNADIDSYHAGAYAGGTIGALALGGGLMLGWQDVAARRLVAIGDFQEGVHTRYRASTMQAFGEAAWRIDLARGTVEPFAGFTHVALKVGSGREAGDVAALALASNSMRTSYTTLGLRGQTAFPLGGRTLSLRASAGWQHAFGDRVGLVDAALGGRRFSVSGVPIAQDSLVGELGVDAALAPALRLNLGYSGALSRTAQDHMARAALIWSF